MVRTLVITMEREARTELLQELSVHDVTCSFTPHNNGVTEAIAAGHPDIYLLEIDSRYSDKDIAALIRRLRKDRDQPIIALVPREILDTVGPQLDVDDFIVSPYDSGELLSRIRRLLVTPGDDVSGDEVIQREGLAVNLTTCEVKVDGAIMELTFKEYELLKLLAANPGRVYTREALLDRIWGYDYFGGDRTVDVHIRRLRSKIEGTGRSFIETVRNIGYRFTPSA